MITTRPLIPVLVLLFAAACSDFALEPDRIPSDLQLSPENPLLTEGDTVRFELTVLDQDGEPFDQRPTWAVPHWTMDRESILEVAEDGLGLATGPGQVTAVAELAGLEAQTPVRVNPVELSVSVAFAHLNQVVQRRAGDVALIAGRSGLLRVYVRGDTPNFFTPGVRVTFYQGGAVVHADTLVAPFNGVPVDVEEGELDLSFDVVLPGSVVQPGTGMVVEVDPEGVVPAASSSELRVPATGELALPVRSVSPFWIRLVPVNQSNGLSSSFTQTGAIDRLWMTENVFPFEEFGGDIRSPYLTEAALNTENGWFDLIEEVAVLRVDDGSPRYYYGGFSIPSGSPYLGLGYVGYPVSIGSDTRPSTLAHEVGHNLNLLHAPCGGPSGVDPDYPYGDGSIGMHGYDRSRDRFFSPDNTYDLMTYCDPAWISDYHYERVIAYRDTSQYDAAFETAGAGAPMPAEEVLIVQGGAADGGLRLGPTLVTTAPPALPRRAGRYTLEGLDESGAVLFSVSLEPRPLDHAGHRSLFTIAIPTARAQPDRLTTLRLTGPEGAVERSRGAAPTAVPPRVVMEDGGAGAPAPGLRWDADAYPLAVLRDRATGRIVAMSRTGRIALPGDPSGLVMDVSDGLTTRRLELER